MRRGNPARPRAGRADARRARGARAAGAAFAAAFPQRRPRHGRRLAGPPGRTGPEALGPGPDRRGPGHRACVQRGRPGPYQIQAAINAVHSVAPGFDRTDWHAIATLYDQLYALTPTPVVALNRAVALAEVRGPAAGLAAVDELCSPALDSYYLFHASRADLLRRLGRDEEAAAAYATARALTANPAEQAFLDTQRAALSP